MNNTKSMKIIKALGNINDGFIEEAAVSVKIADGTDGDFQEAVKVSVPKTKIRLTAYIPFAAVLAVTAAVVVLARTVTLYNSAFDINELLASYGAITDVGVSTEALQNIDTRQASEIVSEMEKSVAEGFSRIEHKLSDKYPPLSEQIDGAKYVLFFDYADGARVRTIICDGLYYIDTEGEIYACESNEDLEHLTELLDKYVIIVKNDLKVTAELDGYKAEQKVGYMTFELNVTFPDGETASFKTELMDYGDLDYQIKMSGFPEIEIYKTEYNGETEYVVMQKVSYEGDNKKVIFFGCDEKYHMLVPYSCYNGYDGKTRIDSISISDSLHRDEDGIFYDETLGTKFFINPQNLRVEVTFYSPWEKEISETETSEVDEYFDKEQLNLSGDVGIDEVIDGDFLYYCKWVNPEADGGQINRIIEMNMLTGEERTLIEEGSSRINGSWTYRPICVRDGYLYYIDQLFHKEEGEYEGVWKLNLSGSSAELVCALDFEYSDAVEAERGIYICGGSSQYKTVYFLDTSDGSLSLAAEKAEMIYAYKSGLIYSLDGSVYYSGDDDMYCEAVLDNGNKKLFSFNNSLPYYDRCFYCNGDYIVVGKPYDIYQYEWHNGGVAYFLYNETDGNFDLLGASSQYVESGSCGEDDIFRINGMLFDMKSGRYFDLLEYIAYVPEDKNWENNYTAHFNYSDGKIYCMTFKADYSDTDVPHLKAELFRLTPK